MRRMTNFWAFIKKLAGLIGFTGDKIEIGNDLEVDGDLTINGGDVVQAVSGTSEGDNWKTLTIGDTTKNLGGGGGGGLDIDLTKGVNLIVNDGTFTSNASSYIDTSASKAQFTAFVFIDSSGNTTKICKYDITLKYIARTEGSSPNLINVPAYMQPSEAPTQYGEYNYMINTAGSSEGLEFSAVSTIRHSRGLRFDGDTRQYIGYYKF